MNRQERLTRYINAMFDKDNVRTVIPDCVQNDFYMEGSVDGKIVIYNICNCSKNLLYQVAWCLYHKHDVTCVTRFNPYTNSGTIRVLIKGDERVANL